eukprot:3410976-Prymnesium_polylepis.1
MAMFGRLFGRSPLRLAAAAAAFAGRTPADCGKLEDMIRHKHEADRVVQLREAVEWCREHDKRGYVAQHRKDDEGSLVWPLAKTSSINRRLDGIVDNDHPFAAHSVLTPTEEADLVATCKELGAHAQGVTREQLGKMVLDSLILRPVLNEGREFTPLSHNAQQI